MRRPFAAACLVVVLAGCGSNASPPDDVLTAAEWRREVNAICRDIGRQVRAIPRPTVETKILEFTAAVTPLWKREEEGIRALSPPPELAGPAKNLGDALAEVNVSLLELHVATERNDDGRAAAAIERGETGGRGVTHWARELRLPACASQRVP